MAASPLSLELASKLTEVDDAVWELEHADEPESDDEAQLLVVDEDDDE
jgi:hypothetical protein